MVLYSNKAKTSTLYKSLSMRFRGRAAFAEVRESAKEVMAAADVSTLPTLKLIGADGTQQVYEGQPLLLMWSVWLSNPRQRPSPTCCL